MSNYNGVGFCVVDTTKAAPCPHGGKPLGKEGIADRGVICGHLPPSSLKNEKTRLSVRSGSGSAELSPAQTLCPQLRLPYTARAGLSLGEVLDLDAATAVR
ncbi:hypothetical protein SRHO_G00155500 [Serrasalmus rhombeus]